MIQKARAFAIRKHGHQMYGSKPYSYHLDKVAELLEPYGEVAQVVGYLHDVVEDTDATVEDIEHEFDPFIARAVAVVTDQEGRTRKERKKKTYKIMAQVHGELTLALVVKAADRLANVQACTESSSNKKLNMYKAEQAEFDQAVYRPNLCEDLWQRLRALIAQ